MADQDASQHPGAQYPQPGVAEQPPDAPRPVRGPLPVAAVPAL